MVQKERVVVETPQMNILGTGLSGLVGSRVTELLNQKYTFTNFSLETGVDITNRDDMLSRITREKDAPWVLHLAAYTNVQQAEIDRDAAWSVNVEATQNIIDACKESDKHMLYVDTDYAFDGKKKDGYTETDAPHPLGWYAKSKTEGARRVLAYNKGLVIRISNPYRANPVGLPARRQGKTDFVHKMLEKLQKSEELVAPTDQLFVPTFIDDIAQAIDKLVSIDATGIFHVVGSEALSPFDAARKVAKTYGLDESFVKPTTFIEYFKNRAPTPRYAVLTNEKVTSLGVTMHGFIGGLAEVKRQEA